MKKFILLRGHEGSGKSHFAHQKITEFLNTYPNSLIIHIDNDHHLINQDGGYQFDFPKFALAHQRNMNLQNQIFQWFKHQTPPYPILLINANPNQKAKTCLKFIQQAQDSDFSVEIYRLHRFFPNQHGISDSEVQQSYARLNANPIDGEIHVF